MEKKILFLAGALVLVATLIGSAAVLATNVATQGATTNKATAIEVRSQDYTTTVSTITFPAGNPGAVISLPTNGVGAEVQTFGAATVAKPVVTLYNGASVTYNIWYQITAFSPNVVASENYVVIAKAGACANADAITQTATLDGTPYITTGGAGEETTILAGVGNERDLYLKVTLSDIAGQAGTSTLTILGESA